MDRMKAVMQISFSSAELNEFTIGESPIQWNLQLNEFIKIRLSEVNYLKFGDLKIFKSFSKWHFELSFGTQIER